MFIRDSKKWRLYLGAKKIGRKSTYKDFLPIFFSKKRKVPLNHLFQWFCDTPFFSYHLKILKCFCDSFLIFRSCTRSSTILWFWPIVILSFYNSILPVSYTHLAQMVMYSKLFKINFTKMDPYEFKTFTDILQRYSDLCKPVKGNGRGKKKK